MTRLFLFDIDGTLLDTGGAGRRAFLKAIEQVTGRAVDPAPDDFAGRTDPAILRRLLSRIDPLGSWAQLVGAIFEAYVEALAEEIETRGAGGLCPGVGRLLDEAGRREDVRIGLLTGNIERGARLKLRALGIDRHFRFGAYGSDEESRDRLFEIAMRRAEEAEGRPLGDARAVLIGDTPHDIGCARSAGVPILAVATGKFSAADLAIDRPDRLLPDLSDVDQALRALLSLTDPLPRGDAIPGRDG